MDRRILAVAVLAAAATQACKSNRVSIEIRGRAFPSDVTKCSFTGTGDFQLGNGVLDVGGTTRNYIAALYVRNNTDDPSTTTPGSDAAAKAWRPSAMKVRVNPSDYTNAYPPVPDLLPIQVSNRLPVSGNLIQPGGGQNVVVGEILSQQIGDRLAITPGVSSQQGGRIVVGITIEGETLDGASVDTGEWYFPIDVCTNCLGIFPAPAPLPGCTDPAQKLSCCPGAPWQDVCTCQ